MFYPWHTNPHPWHYLQTTNSWREDLLRMPCYQTDCKTAWSQVLKISWGQNHQADPSFCCTPSPSPPQCSKGTLGSCHHLLSDLYPEFPWVVSFCPYLWGMLKTTCRISGDQSCSPIFYVRRHNLWSSAHNVFVLHRGTNRPYSPLCQTECW